MRRLVVILLSIMLIIIYFFTLGIRNSFAYDNNFWGIRAYNSCDLSSIFSDNYYGLINWNNDSGLNSGLLGYNNCGLGNWGSYHASGSLSNYGLSYYGLGGGWVGYDCISSGYFSNYTPSYRFNGGYSLSYGAGFWNKTAITPSSKEAPQNNKETSYIQRVEHNGQSTSGFSGKLVAGDILSVHLTGAAGEIAFFSLGSEGKTIPMQESPISAGVYEGTYTIVYGDDGDNISVYGYLSDEAGNVVSKAGDTPLSIDTHLTITVTPRKIELPADNKSQTEVVIKVSDINKNPVSGHHMALTLAATDEFTDAIGAGNFGREIDGKLSVDFENVTDNSGQLSAIYTAGFAAKTALIIAKDLDTGYAGAGYIVPERKGANGMFLM